MKAEKKIGPRVNFYRTASATIMITLKNIEQKSNQGPERFVELVIVFNKSQVKGKMVVNGKPNAPS